MRMWRHASPGPTPSHPIPPVNAPRDVEQQDEPVKEPREAPPATEPPDSVNPARRVF